jgi:hypothetical protein
LMPKVTLTKLLFFTHLPCNVAVFLFCFWEAPKCFQNNNQKRFNVRLTFQSPNSTEVAPT